MQTAETMRQHPVHRGQHQEVMRAVVILVVQIRRWHQGGEKLATALAMPLLIG